MADGSRHFQAHGIYGADQDSDLVAGGEADLLRLNTDMLVTAFRAILARMPFWNALSGNRRINARAAGLQLWAKDGAA